MARERDPNRDKAYEIWKQHDGNITNREIAHLLSTDEKKIAVWKQRDKWNVVQQKKKNVVQQKKKTTKKARSPNSKQKNRSGNPHPSQKFPERNTFALKHGLFSRYIPKETLEIMGMLDKAEPADLIWDQIQIQYAAIIRAQRIMFVQDQDDMTKEIKKEKSAHSDTMTSEETEWEIQFAWDKHATFLNAQSRAMSELRSLIKQFNELAHEDDERRLKLEKMQLGIDKTKAEIEKLKGNGDSDDDLIDEWVEAVTEDEE
jgi:uncharacterized protein YjcR